MLDVLVPEIRLHGARIVSGIRQCKAGRMPEHVRVGFQPKISRLGGPFDHPRESGRCERSAPLAQEHEGAGLALALQLAKDAHFWPTQWMHARCPALDPTNV